MCVNMYTSAYVCTSMWNLKCGSSGVIHLTFQNTFIPLFVYVVVHVTWHMCLRGSRTDCSLSSFSHMGPGIKLRS